LHFVDLDADGDLDLFLSSHGRGPSLAALGNGNGRFVKASGTYPSSEIHLAYDSDEDGKVDLTMTYQDGGGQWWLNRSQPGKLDFQATDITRGTNTARRQAMIDINRDGRLDIIGVRGDFPPFTSELYWLGAPEDPLTGEWKPHYIGKGDGDFPHGAAVGPILADGRIALVLGYHSAGGGDTPQCFEVPTDPTQPWTKKKLANIRYGEEIVLADVDGDGELDIIAGPYWLERQGEEWMVHEITDPEGWQMARVRVADMNENGRHDVVVSEERFEDYPAKVLGLGRVTWFEAPEDPRAGEWVEHPISVMRCPHSLDVADLDGDGDVEVIVGEHDPFMAYNPNAYCKLVVYKRVDKAGTVWAEHVIDTRFEHHDGAHAIRLDQKGRLGIVSHGWTEDKYVHLWK